MPRRKTELANEEYYHVYNRGVDKRTIFQEEADYQRFLLGLEQFNAVQPIGSLFENQFRLKNQPELGARDSKLVQIVAYCLNPNHYHLLLKQVSDNGISTFMRRMTGGYVMYFNEKHQRSGSLFQGTFKAAHVADDHYLKHLSVYINLNNEIHKIPQKQKQLTKSSWVQYCEPDKPLTGPKIASKIILDYFPNEQAYCAFAKRTLPEIQARKTQSKHEAKIYID